MSAKNSSPRGAGNGFSISSHHHVYVIWPMAAAESMHHKGELFDGGMGVDKCF